MNMNAIVSTGARVGLIIGLFFFFACGGEVKKQEGLPGAPSGLLVVPDSTTEISLSWTDNADNETGFVVERSSDGVAYVEVHTAERNETTWTDGGLVHSSRYFYRVYSVNVKGSSGFSNVAVTSTLCDGDTSLRCGDACFDPNTSLFHCGLCNQACTAGQVCNAGACSPHCSGLTPSRCGNACVNTNVDRLHCGSCGNECEDGEVCSSGNCQLSCGGATPTRCHDACVNMQNDRHHCGACGNACLSGEVCSSGNCQLSCGGTTPTRCEEACVNTLTDRHHCGICQNTCPDGMVCSEGECVLECGGATPLQCENACVDPISNRHHCGDCDIPCEPGSICDEGSCQVSCQNHLTNCFDLCVDLQHHPHHCGSCGHACTPPANATSVCHEASCGYLCLPGYADCDGDPATGCHFLAMDPNHCGACGIQCDSDQVCAEGICRTFIENGSFETGDYSGWTLFIDNWSNLWGIAQHGQTLEPWQMMHDFFTGMDTVSSSVGLPFTVTATQGSRLAVNLQDGPSLHRMYQDVTLPDFPTVLRWDMQYRNHAGGFDDFSQYIALHIRHPGTDEILSTPYKTTDGVDEVFLDSMQTFTVDLSAHAGQTVRIDLEIEVQDFYFDVYLDNFRLTYP